MRAAIILLIVIAAPAPLQAQAANRISGPQPSLVWAARPDPSDTTLVRRGSHWQTGALVGGLAGGAFGLAVMRSVCALSETDTDCTGNTILGSLIFGAAGATVGAIVGGLFPRH